MGGANSLFQKQKSTYTKALKHKNELRGSFFFFGHDVLTDWAENCEMQVKTSKRLTASQLLRLSAIYY